MFWRLFDAGDFLMLLSLIVTVVLILYKFPIFRCWGFPYVVAAL